MRVAEFEMDKTNGYRANYMRWFEDGRYPCVHGDICRNYWNRFRTILSSNCPYSCEHYKPKEKTNE